MTGTLHTPLGPVSLREAAGRIAELMWRPGEGEPTALEAEGLRQLAEYFAGKRQAFDLPLDWGAGLHERVRRAMAAIPFGETRTYGALSRQVEAPAQAVGQACGANPLPILIPCHRVLGANTLGGFSAPGGVESKVWLLRHEGAAGLLI
ncbi:methylated-DNA--[protein]-cysteine S-methyltransferase [Pseudogemmobacter blasticus]|nr:methylated-DNA--[protein]-cysteine S-methyltransferase [Fuscovulum blasticum]